MKLFLILTLLSCSHIALAQNQEDTTLFPELSAFSSPNYKELDNQPKNNVTIPQEKQLEQLEGEIPNEESFNAGITNEENLFEQKQPEISEEEIDQSDEETQEEEEDKEEDKQQKIVITINDVDATLTSDRNASFCSAIFAVGNGLKKEIKSFSGSFTIGSTTKKFAFNNIAKQNVFAKKYMFVGTSCEQITNEPQLEIESCQVEGWSEKKCKAKVQFIPIPKNQDLVLE